MDGWPESDNMTISVQLNLTGTGTGTELGKNKCKRINYFCFEGAIMPEKVKGTSVPQIIYYDLILILVYL